MNGLTVKAFLGALKFNFELMLMPGFPCKPVEKHCMGMYVDGQWYHLKAWPDIYEKKDVVGQLDVSILQEKSSDQSWESKIRAQTRESPLWAEAIRQQSWQRLRTEPAV